jgi:hypothetical protein
VDRVSQWLATQGIDNVSALHEIRVELRATRHVIVYETPAGWWGASTETHVVTLTADPFQKLEPKPSRRTEWTGPRRNRQARPIEKSIGRACAFALASRGCRAAVGTAQLAARVRRRPPRALPVVIEPIV